MATTASVAPTVAVAVVAAPVATAVAVIAAAVIAVAVIAVAVIAVFTQGISTGNVGDGGVSAVIAVFTCTGLSRNDSRKYRNSEEPRTRQAQDSYKRHD
ncbi:hypothetical protein [Rhodococcus globerulus]|uniref:hypothetical protein n=1 Tax=Rhodococcus globerulus TaxID=33008 RepID=UPI00301932FD